MDVIAEFLTRIRNSGMAKHEKVDVLTSSMKEGIAQILKQNGYIRDFKVAKVGERGFMRVYLKYDNKGKHAIEYIERVSTPGRRVYINSDKIPTVRSGLGLVILSTNKGIMSGGDAAKLKCGGELLCKMW